MSINNINKLICSLWNKIKYTLIFFRNICIQKIYKIKQSNKKNRYILFIVAVIFIIFYLFIFRAPENFPVGEMIEIKEGMPLAEISGYLKDLSVIRSELLFEAFVTILASDTGALHGEYFFNKRLSSFSVAKRITKGVFGLELVRVTVPEGSTIYDIMNIFEQKFSKFDSELFLKNTASKEGYLFPDTYLFLPNVKENQITKEMEKTFEQKVSELSEEINGFGKSLQDVIIMASILEKEARTTESRRIIAGILWKRIEIGMPLQVDAVFPYINGKNTYTLTLDDLKIDSPYNTYKYKGLPIGPIANPGIDSIKAAITPIESSYLYYLSDKEGNMYYAENFEEHKKNKRLYIK